MKKLLLIILAMVTLLASCTPYMYGVPQESWERMSEAERVEAIRGYEREQQARRRAAEERARYDELAREQERARQAVLERRQRERIEAIHRGDGAYGELLRVRLQGGSIKIGGRHYRYEPVTFTIADSETREFTVTDNKGRVVHLSVTYAGGALTVEDSRFPYERSWGRGKLFSDIATTGALQLRGVDIFIEVHNRSSRFEREMSRMVVIPDETPRREVREKEAPKPQRIAGREREEPKPQRVTDREKDAHKPTQPLRQTDPPATVHAPRVVEVVILAGDMKVRGERLKVERASLRIVEGDSRELLFRAGEAKETVTIRYQNGELIFAENFKGKHDAVRLPFEKEWEKGKVYRLAFKGRMALEKVEIKVIGIAER